jgi:signal transduction histidine kinase
LHDVVQLAGGKLPDRLLHSGADRVRDNVEKGFAQEDVYRAISKAREDLIRQERIATIGRLSTSIIHDLRNPLAAIYGGAEMLVDALDSGLSGARPMSDALAEYQQRRLLHRERGIMCS